MRFLHRYCSIVLLASLLLAGCIQRMAIRTVGGIIDEYGFATLNEETDLDLAEKSIASNIKLIEIFHKGDPDNEELLLLLSMGYTSYTIGFVEDDSVDRARTFYLRGRDFGMEVLKRNRNFADALGGTLDDFRAALASLSKDDTPALFWTAMGWGSYINLSLTDPDALADIPRVEAMMERVKTLDSSFYYGGAYLFLGALYGSRPKILGGNPDLAKRYFDQCLRINEGRFLLTHIYYARSYAVQEQKEQLFVELLDKVRDAPSDILPEARLPNAIAKKKASILRSRVHELF